MVFNTLIFLAFLCREQPPSGGCVLKQDVLQQHGINSPQPPSGGCVLKLLMSVILIPPLDAAAFGRLCVETAPLKGVMKSLDGSRLRAAVC